jgi:peroxiredoxin
MALSHDQAGGFGTVNRGRPFMNTPTPISDQTIGKSLDQGSRLPSLLMASSRGEMVDLSTVRGDVILLLHPVALPPDLAPTPDVDALYAIQASIDVLRLFDGAMPHLTRQGVQVFGLSVQSTPIQRMVADALGLSFSLLSDASGVFARTTALPLVRHGRLARLPALVVVLKDGVVQRRIIPDGTLDPLALVGGRCCDSKEA